MRINTPDKFVLDTLDNFPKQPAFHPGSEQLVRLGEIAVFRAGWGIPLTNNDILVFAQLRGHTNLTELSTSLEATGFTNGYYSPFTVNHRSAEVQHWHVIYAVELTKRVMQARGWDSLDILILGTSKASLRKFAPNYIGKDWLSTKLNYMFKPVIVQLQGLQIFAGAKPIMGNGRWFWVLRH